MRITGGHHRGRALQAPAGRSTRPTAQRTRETAFNILAHAPWAPPLAGARVIDLFAGSGALGLEALSRGAQFCLFVETDARARGVIRANIETLALTGMTRLHRRSATALGQRPAGLGTPFSHAFLDPPYAHGLAEPSLAGLADGAWIEPGGLAMVETARDDALDAPGWRIQTTRNQGAARLWFLTRSD